MEPITVNSIEQKQKKDGDPYWQVKYNVDEGNQGEYASVWEHHIASYLLITKGEQVNVKITTNGRFKNIVGVDSQMSIDQVSEAASGSEFDKPTPKQYKGGFGGKADPAKLRSIERQTSAKIAAGVVKFDNMNEFEDVADKIYSWITQE